MTPSRQEKRLFLILYENFLGNDFFLLFAGSIIHKRIIFHILSNPFLNHLYPLVLQKLSDRVAYLLLIRYEYTWDVQRRISVQQQLTCNPASDAD